MEVPRRKCPSGTANLPAAPVHPATEGSTSGRGNRSNRLPARQGAIQPVARLDACPIARSADTTADDLWTPTPTADG